MSLHKFIMNTEKFWIWVFRIAPILIVGAFAYVNMWGDGKWMDKEETKAEIRIHAATEVIPRIVHAEDHLDDLNKHFGFNERSEFITKDDWKEMQSSITKLDDKLDRLLKR